MPLFLFFVVSEYVYFDDVVCDAFAFEVVDFRFEAVEVEVDAEFAVFREIVDFEPIYFEREAWSPVGTVVFVCACLAVCAVVVVEDVAFEFFFAVEDDAIEVFVEFGSVVCAFAIA